MIMASAFSAILVYAQELMPGRVGLVAGMFFGFSFGLGGLGAAALGQLADPPVRDGLQAHTFLLLLGLLTRSCAPAGRAQKPPTSCRSTTASRCGRDRRMARPPASASRIVAPVLTLFGSCQPRPQVRPGGLAAPQPAGARVVLVVMLVTAIAYFVYDTTVAAPPSSATT